MIDITKSKLAFKTFLDNYEDKSDASFKLKVVHTYHVADNAREIAKKLNLSKEDMENATLSNKVYETILNKKCVDIHDRVTPLDFWVCILAFTFDLNFDVTYQIVKDNDYVNILIDRFDYKDIVTKERMEIIRNIINDFINEKLRK